MKTSTTVFKLPERPPRPLTLDDFSRFSRQLILPEIGRQGQQNLINSSVLIVGCGGLGCPVIQYLAAGGVGRFGLIDNDVVDTSNIQRQILHMESDHGKLKVQSAAETIKSLNSNAEVFCFNLTVDSSNASEFVDQFDVVVDCTDNVATRYLLNDACFLSDKRVPLVSGAALRWDGQVTVYKDDSCCYRCVHPQPPAPESVTNCSDGGVIGAVCGVVGAIQATEALKILAGVESSLEGHMIIYDGLRASTRTIKLRPKKPECLLCGNKEIKELVDYSQFCGMAADDKDKPLDLLEASERVEVKDLRNLSNALIIDVRTPTEFDLCRLQDTINVPLKKLRREPDALKDLIPEGTKELVFLCRKGNDSQVAALFWKSITKDYIVRDVKNGLYAWHFQMDNSFPIY